MPRLWRPTPFKCDRRQDWVNIDPFAEYPFLPGLDDASRIQPIRPGEILFSQMEKSR